MLAAIKKAVLVALIVIVPATAAAERIAGELIIKWADDDLDYAGALAVIGEGVEKGHAISDDTWVYRLVDRSDETLDRALSNLENHASVRYAESNLVRRTFRKANDPHVPLQWYLKPINIERAWDRTTGSRSVVVAVVDTGIQQHPELAGRMVAGFDFISDKANAGDGNGWDNNPSDAGTNTAASSAYHGTHVAGIIAAKGDNKSGTAGIDWGCRVQAIRVMGIDGGKGSDADIAAGIRWSAGVAVPGAPKNPTPARVINLSFGGAGASKVLTDAVVAAQTRGAIVVAAMGNLGGDGSNIYPAAITGVISVGATDNTGKRASYSNYGRIVDVMAPGGSLKTKLSIFHNKRNDWPAGIVSTMYYKDRKDPWGYHLYEGTSQAAPIVAGVVSLMVAAKPKLTAGQALTVLKATANSAGKCSQGCGAGMVDAARAVAMAATLPDAKAPVPPTGTTSGLPYNTKCSGDSQCASKVCRSVPISGGICTRHCKSAADCPSGSVCGGICMPRAPATPAPPSTGGQGGGTRAPSPGTGNGTSNSTGPAQEVVGYCSVASDGIGDPLVELGFLLVIALAARIRRRRR